MPVGVSWNSNREYADRITRWRDNRQLKKLTTRAGYFREIYPINFVLDTHLAMPFRGGMLSEFMQANGTLRPLDMHDEIFRWDVPDPIIPHVRGSLEESGLILSSNAPPLIIN